MRVLLLVILIIMLFPSNLCCQINWVEYSENPVLEIDSSEGWEQTFISPGAVLFIDNLYHMWYTAGEHKKRGDHTVKQYSIGYAISKDGINWAKSANNPVLTPERDGDWIYSSIENPTVIYHDSIFHMWYDGGSGYYWDNYQIGHAISKDGISWVKDSLNNPVIGLGAEGEWDDLAIGNSSVIHDGNEFHMWYSGMTGIYQNSIGHATSPDGVRWLKDAKNPGLLPGNYLSLYGGYDRWGAYDPSVILHRSTFLMWYTGVEAHHGSHICYATSANGRTWVRDTINGPILCGGGSLGFGNISIPEVIYDQVESKFKMWYYKENKDGICSIAYAESELETTGGSNQEFIRFTIFPNPSNGSINIRLNNKGRYRMDIYSETGQLIHRTHLHRQSEQLDISFLLPGVYYMVIGSKDSLVAKKIVKL